MLLGEETRQDDLIVRLLAENPGLTLEALHKSVKENGCRRSIKALYKELARLRRTGVVLRHDRKYSLQLSWVFEIYGFACDLTQTYLRGNYFNTLLPEPGARIEWKFRNLSSLDVFWTQLVISLVKNSKESEIFEWLPHPWFILQSGAPEIRLQKAIQRLSRKACILIGSDHYLDRLAEKVFDPKVYDYHFATDFVPEQKSTYLDVVDDWVLTVKLPAALEKALDELYQKVGSSRELKIADVVRVLQQPANIRVVLENNAYRATRLKRQFKLYLS